MKVKVLKRDPGDYIRATDRDIHRLPRNFDPAEHPFEAAREYKRALNAAKLERMFAKPFLGDLNGHSDGISALSLHPQRLSVAASASFDGQIILWDLSTRKSLVKFGAGGYVRGLEFNPDGDKLYSVGDDKKIHVWNTSESGGCREDAVASKSVLMDVSHHGREKVVATCGEVVTVWDTELRTQVAEYSWGVDSVHKVKFNPVETHLLLGAASDNSVLLYDTRERGRPMRRVIMDLRSNDLAWNPMEAFVFATASEDYNAYAFDIRQLKRPLNVHMDHTAAVTAVAYSPTGRELVTGGYDKTVRLYKVDEGHSREVYHTKRMQRVTSVAWSRDNRFILSGSDEMNVRLWKAKAWEKLGVVKDRQKAALEYSDKLKEKYGSHPKVRQIVKKRHVPKHVLNAKKEHKVIKDSQKRKEANRRKHSKPGTVPYTAERDKHFVREDE